MKYGILTFEELEKDISKKILHVDMDAFYASIEVRDNPKLRNKPVIIAKHPNLTNGRGIVSTCNYEARKFGIHSAMSALEAYKRCPKGIFISGNHSKYREVSMQIKEIFYLYTDLVERVALDEAYLDVTQNYKSQISATILAKELQEEIWQKTQLTCSIGVSYNKFLAKLGSDYKKPKGITVIEPENAESFLRKLSIDKFKGIGKKTLEKFYQANIYTGEDLYQTSFEFLIDNFGKMGYSLYYKVRGISSNVVSSQQMTKSVSRERTFIEFIQDEHLVLSVLYQLCQNVVEKVNKEKLNGYTVSIKVRYKDFETMTRQYSSDQPIRTIKRCYEMVEQLWKSHGHLNQSIRLLGVTISNFSEFEEINLDIET